MYAAYHAAWLFFDLEHLNRPWALFFAIMALWGLIRAIRWRMRRR